LSLTFKALILSLLGRIAQMKNGSTQLERRRERVALRKWLLATLMISSTKERIKLKNGDIAFLLQKKRERTSTK